MMAVQDVVVIGASAGGVEALRHLAAALPVDFAAAVFAVVQIGQRRSVLPEILTKAGRLPTLHPRDGQEIQPRTIYVAPPDHHLVVEHGHIHLSHGPQENRARPAINPLFRSVAIAYGPRVAGVILTGVLDDGVSGLWEIKRRGGVAIVQDPEEAAFPSMPYEAIRHVAVDHVVTLSQMASILSDLSTTDRTPPHFEVQAITKTVSEITCPDCGGTLWEEQKGTLVDYRCRVGHAYSTLGVADHHQDAQETALWAAAVALEEGAAIDERLAAQLGSSYKANAQKKRDQAGVLKRMLSSLKSNAVHENDRSSPGHGGGHSGTVRGRTVHKPRE